MKKVKCLCIGLDGATFDLIYPWIQEGTLPVLKNLIENGSYGNLETVFPPLTAPAWSSFFTGKNPGKHGIYDFLYREEGKYTSKPNNRLTRRALDFWVILNQYDFFTGLINVPMTYPPQSIKGYMITGIMTPRSSSLEKINYTYPESLRFELKDTVGNYIIHPKIPYRRGKAKSVYKELVEDLRIKSKTIQFLLDKYHTDLFMFVIGGTDKILHDLYHLIDVNHPYHSFKEAKEDGHLIKDYYKLVDKELGTIINKFCDDETLIIVMSDHGMGPLYKWIHLNVWLMKEGYIKLRRSIFVKMKKLLFNMGFTPSNIYKILLKFGFSKAKVSFQARDKLISQLFLSWNDIDWKQTKAYSRGHVGQLFINKKGREPEGIVSDEEFDALKTEIEAKLLQFKDKDRNIIEKILNPDEIYKGPYRHLSADILFMPSRLEYMALGTSAFISKKAVELCFGSTGNHRMNGIFIIKGKGIKKNYKIQGAKITDIVPNLLFYYDLHIEKEMDGKILIDVYEPDFFQSKKIDYKKLDKKPGKEEEGKKAYSTEEVKSIKKTLADLGYLG